MPAGEGVAEVDVLALQSRIQRLWRTDFADLDLIRGATRTAAALQTADGSGDRDAAKSTYGSKTVVFDFLRHASGNYGPEDFAPTNNGFELRYGACRAW